MLSVVRDKSRVVMDWKKERNVVDDGVKSRKKFEMRLCSDPSCIDHGRRSSNFWLTSPDPYGNLSTNHDKHMYNDCLSGWNDNGFLRVFLYHLCISSVFRKRTVS